MNLLSELKKFILRGNLIEMAVAFIVAAQVALIVQSFVNNIVMAFIGAVFGESNFRSVTFGVGEGDVFVGAFITDVINFVIILTAVFFMVKAYDTLQARRLHGQGKPEEEPTPTDEAVLLREIRDLLARQRG
ncbi:MAG: large conductance mechanosensitive channel protein MscL [Actinomycetota bacterium]|nr:large conductance mechanosensitive channel protein MscL [Actinomycetota bacterium]